MTVNSIEVILNRVIEPRAVAPRTVTLIGVVLLILITMLDIVTGEQVSLAPLYMILVVLIAWHGGTRLGLYFTAAVFAGLLAMGLFLGQPYSSEIYFVLNTAGLVACFVPAVLVMPRLRQALDRERELARTDPLTRIANRARFHDALTAEMLRQQRSRRPFAIAFIDCDDFKSINDRFGHAAGDEALRSVAETLTETLRVTDLPARLGSDEFAVLLPEINPRESLRVAERLRHRLVASMLARDWPLTFSIGMAVFQKAPTAAGDVFALADGLMYRVKRTGRGQILREIY